MLLVARAERPHFSPQDKWSVGCFETAPCIGGRGSVLTHGNRLCKSELAPQPNDAIRGLAVNKQSCKFVPSDTNQGGDMTKHVIAGGGETTKLPRVS